MSFRGPEAHDGRPRKARGLRLYPLTAVSARSKVSSQFPNPGRPLSLLDLRQSDEGPAKEHQSGEQDEAGPEGIPDQFALNREQGFVLALHLFQFFR